MTWAALLLAALAAYAVAGWLRRPMDASAREGAPGQFATLSQGVTHYRWDGPARGPVAVCVHGLASASYVWEAVVRALTMMGFRVLRYDLYGRGLSDRPAGRQDAEFFLRQLRDLLEDQGLAGDLTLLGYSMGGGIATCFAADEPHRVDRLILLAPAGLGHDPALLHRLARSVPLFGDWLMQVLGGWQIRRDARRAGRLPVAVEGIARMQMNEVRFRGFLPAVLSSLRYMLAADLSSQHRVIAEAGIPVLAVWGDADPAIPLSGLGRLSEINRAARQVQVKGATHALPYTHPREIHAAIQEFLRAV
ncbi:alpha/beta hydrolase [Actibacterium sp. MT2.3-13A]|uniref:alpha/beta fold hydrolase n=1 Tax=Actibacterium sp. MT2.3-13A TaxID=2828332 RepID=UPI001BA7AD89|nr:alpha/beta hydrolase [Actibacterium sp. MT2.3-13A]